jgi:hypothetical protein
VLLYRKVFVSLHKNIVMIHIEYLQEYIHQRKRERVRFNDIAGRINRFLSLRLLLSLMFMSLGLMSCSSDDVDEDAKRREFVQIVENRSAKDLLNDLYVGSDGDIQSLSRMLNVTPSSIERIRKGETEPTDKFDNRIKEVSIYYFQNEQSYSKLRSILDDEWGWYDTLWNLPNFYPYWFWGVTLVIFLLGCFLHGAILIGNVVELVLMGVAWCFIYFATPDDMDDKYIETINPTIERVI